LALRHAKKWTTKNLATLDLDTGEVTPGLSIHVPIKIRVGDHIAVMQEAAIAVALDREITPTALRVLKFLEGMLDYENAIRIVQADIADAMGLRRPHVSTAIKLLLDKGIIEKINSPSLKPVFRLNPNYGWRGKHGNWAEARKSSAPLRLVSSQNFPTNA
jgi:hypothetical protein